VRAPGEHRAGSNERTDDRFDILCLAWRDIARLLHVKELARAEGERERLVEVSEVVVELGGDQRSQLA
jgi:hypothetical protein